MKAILFISLVCSALISCNKEQRDSQDSQQNSSIERKWRLSQIYIQTAGPGSWRSTDSLPVSYIQFNADGTLISSSYISSLYNDANRYQITGDSAVNLIGTGTNSAVYYINDTMLTIFPFCQEGCGQIYIAVKQDSVGR